MQACILEDQVNQGTTGLDLVDPKEIAGEYLFSDYTKDLENLKSDTLAISSFSQNRITGTIEVEKTKLLFFSIPYDEGWRAEIDGKEVKPLLCNIGFIGLLIPPGSHSVELAFKPRYFTITLVLSIVGIAVYLLLAVMSYRRRN